MSLFVGDLSIFCKEADLHLLFSSFGAVPNKIQIKRGKLNEPLQYGFVVLPHHLGLQAIDRLNGTKLLGRRIKIKAKGSQEPGSSLDSERNRISWAQVHFSFITHQADIHIGEEALDRIFSSLGAVADIAIKQHSITLTPPRQTAYGFVYFYEADAAQRAMNEMKHVSIEGIVFDCNYVNERDVDGDIRRKMLAKQKSPSPLEATAVAAESGNNKHPSLLQQGYRPPFEQEISRGPELSAVGPAPLSYTVPLPPLGSQQQMQASQWTYFYTASPPPPPPPPPPPHVSGVFNHHHHHHHHATAATAVYPGTDAYSNHALFTTGAYHLPSLSSASTDSFGSYGISLMHSASSDYEGIGGPHSHHHTAVAMPLPPQPHPGIAMMMPLPQQQFLPPPVSSGPIVTGSLLEYSTGIALNDYHQLQQQQRQAQQINFHQQQQVFLQHRQQQQYQLPLSPPSYSEPYFFSNQQQQPSLVWQPPPGRHHGGGAQQQQQQRRNHTPSGLSPPRR